MSSKSAVSFELNNLGPWADPLLAGITGSPSIVNFMDPIETAIPIIQGGGESAFNVGHFRAFQERPRVGAGGTGIDTDKVLETPGTRNPDMIATDAIGKILDTIFGRERATEIFTRGGILDSTKPISERVAGTSLENAGKYVLLAIVGLILIVFGLWILLGPTAKSIVREAV
jgi:hypothetical protein